jgi:hypothetical protein
VIVTEPSNSLSATTPETAVENTATPAETPAPVEQIHKNVVFRPNPGPQTAFLAASEREVLYGGASGGGKSYAILADPMRYMHHPQFSGLILRHTTEELRELIWKSQELYPKIYPGIKWSERKLQWETPQGGRLWMSYLDRDEDVMRYQGLSFCVAKGTPVKLSDGSYKNIEDISVDDTVATLEGSGKVVWKSSVMKKKCVVATTYTSSGKLIGTQVHPLDHCFSLLSDKAIQNTDEARKFVAADIQWKSYLDVPDANGMFPVALSYNDGLSYEQTSYDHPYTGEQRPIQVWLSVGVVRFTKIDDLFVEVYDLTVDKHNHYITGNGLINKNCYIAWDELTQWPTPFAYNYMRSRLRTTAPDLPLSIRATTNPGGPGMAWVKKMFVDPAPFNTPFYATDIETGKPLVYPKGHSKEGEYLFKRRFIPAKLSDNPSLAASGDYESMLLSLPEQQRKQLLEGNWDIAEGAAFSEFNRAIHVVEPFTIPSSWPRFRGCDYGYSSFSAVLWFAVAPDDQLVCYRELYVTKMVAEDLADAVMEAEKHEKVRYGVLDSSCWHNRTGGGPSIAERMIVRGCRWRPADRSAGSRVAGKNEIHRRLQVDPYTEKPRLVFFNNCTHIIADLPTLPLDKTNTEDINTKVKNDHGYDALRYSVMSRPRSGIFDFDTSSQRSGFIPSDPYMGY